jgi:heme-degrading monooxygenase HmoA
MRDYSTLIGKRFQVYFLKRLSVKSGKVEEAYALLNKIRSHATHQPGYVSGETLSNHYDDRSITVISTWQSVDDWIRWEESDERASNEAELESLLEEPTKFEVYDVGRTPT